MISIVILIIFIIIRLSIGLLGNRRIFKQSSYLHWVKKGIYQIGWGHTELRDLEEMKLE
jgi:hypothetical protein